MTFLLSDSVSDPQVFAHLQMEQTKVNKLREEQKCEEHLPRCS